MLGEGQLIRELKLEGVNHYKLRKWVKIMCMPESMYHGGALSPQRDKGSWKLKAASKI
jgi:hypothetical protein